MEKFALTLRPSDAVQSGGEVPPAQRLWRVITLLLLAAIFAEAAFAGAMLSGFPWARAAHLASAALLIFGAVTAACFALATLRRVPQGTKLGLMLLGLAVLLFLQTAIGKFAANGSNLLWLHVPFGVALVGLAAQAAARACNLGNR
ncbi:MAG: hypothetical protein KF765_08795 [Parvibaculaceae bacterium]|nr:hypothetical protein [Parvibaculaceae bacterium]